MRRLLAPSVAVLLALPASAVTLEWVPVGDPGNAPDDAANCLYDGCGAVPYEYRIAKHEVTNAQYVEFLNAKAATDPHGLFSPLMQSEEHGGITRSGDPGSYIYAPKPGFANKPVNYVTFYDALRFVNWLGNGQGGADTETGAYTITVQGIDDNTIVRNPGADLVIPTENEWYKAAFFDGIRYFDYPAGSDAPIDCAAPTAAPNSANCEEQAGGATDVGSYPGSPSPYGTLDQGGNHYEMNETIQDAFRGLRGGGWGDGDFQLAADVVDLVAPTQEYGIRIGLRVVKLVPEPAAGAGAAVAAIGALVAGDRRRAG